MKQEQRPERTPGAEKDSKDISRREFARRAALASAVASLGPAQAVAGVASAQTPNPTAPASPQTTVPAQTSQAVQAPNLPKLSAESQAEADARLQAILAQYGSRFSDDQKADLHRLCVMAQPQLDRLRAYNVENGVSPALYLKPLVEREKKPAAPVAPGGPVSPKTSAAPAANAPPAAKPPTAPKKP
jgi:hypothetical protein